MERIMPTAEEIFNSSYAAEFNADPEMSGLTAAGRAISDICLASGISPLEFPRPGSPGMSGRIALALEISHFWHGTINGSLCNARRDSSFSAICGEIRSISRYATRRLPDSPEPFTSFFHGSAREKLSRIEFSMNPGRHFDQFAEICGKLCRKLRWESDVLRAIGAPFEECDIPLRHAAEVERHRVAHMEKWQIIRAQLLEEIAQEPIRAALSIRDISKSQRRPKDFVAMLSDEEFIASQLWIISRQSVKKTDLEKIPFDEFGGYQKHRMEHARKIFHGTQFDIALELHGAMDSRAVLTDPDGNQWDLNLENFAYIKRITRADSFTGGFCGIGIGPIAVVALFRDGHIVAVIPAKTDPHPAEFDMQTARSRHLSVVSE